MGRRFRYLLDPLFLAAVGLYLVGRFLIRPHIPAPSFFHSHMNDLLCIPFWLPPVLLVERKLRLRSHDQPPAPPEIALHLIVWAIAFEVVGPRLEMFSMSVADPLDIFWYAVGALAGALIWNYPLGANLPGRGP
jgi:hypothetical protein